MWLVKQPPPPRKLGIEPDPACYGPRDLSEAVHMNARAGPEHDVSAVRVKRQRRLALDLMPDLVEDAEILEDDLEVDMKIAGQFVRAKDIQRGVVGPRCRQIEPA